MVALGSTAIDTTKFGSLDVTSLYLGSNEAWTAGEPAELINPTSIANSGGTASVGTNGQVTFSGVTSLSLNGVFSADFDNYVVSVRVSPSSNDYVDFKLRSSGTDTSGSDYTFQQLQVNGTGVNAARSSGNAVTRLAFIATTVRNGFNVNIYGPALAQPTALRSFSVGSLNSAYIGDYATTHSLSTAYDGFSLIGEGGISLTGALQVYGIRM